MTSARAAAELWDALCAVREPLAALSITVWEDRPENDDMVLADRVGDAVVEVCGWLEGAIGAVRDARDAADDRAGLGESLADCGQHFDRLEKTFWSELASYERLSELAALSTERPPWKGWADGVRHAVGDCAELIHHARSALFECWAQATRDSARPLVAVTATNVGQHFGQPVAGGRRRAANFTATEDTEG